MKVFNPKWKGREMKFPLGSIYFDEEGVSEEVTKSDARLLMVMGCEPYDEKEELKKVFREEKELLKK